jgi:hypothetical protein
LFLEEKYGAFQEEANNLIPTHGNKGSCGQFLFFQYLVEKAKEDSKNPQVCGNVRQQLQKMNTEISTLSQEFPCKHTISNAKTSWASPIT